MLFFSLENAFFFLISKLFLKIIQPHPLNITFLLKNITFYLKKIHF